MRTAETSSLLRRVALVLALGLGATFALRISDCGPGSGLRVGTYNIRRFGVEPTDMARLTEIIADTKSDVLAVQEIQSKEKLGELADRLSRVRGRRFAVALSTCGGKSAMHVGFLYDTTRVEVLSTREYPQLDPGGDGACVTGERPGFAVTFTRAKTKSLDARFTLLAVHMIAGGDREKIERRKKQWRDAHAIAKELGRDGAAVAILGDTNSTGFLDDRGGERTFILDEADKNGLEVTTSKLDCSEYWGPIDGKLQPSLLDHVVATPGMGRKGSVRLHGYCEKLACSPTGTKPTDYVSVSDHCPITLDLP